MWTTSASHLIDLKPLMQDKVQQSYGYYSNNINNNYHVLSMCQALKYFVLLLLLLILSNTFMKNYYYAHFTEDEIKAKRLSKFQRNTPRK